MGAGRFTPIPRPRPEHPRTSLARAEALFANRGQWLRVRTPDGKQAFGMPSFTQDGRYYVCNGYRCDCPGFRIHGLSSSRIGDSGLHTPCCHVLAAQMLFQEQLVAGRQPDGAETEQ